MCQLHNIQDLGKYPAIRMNKKGTNFMHTCNGDVVSGLPFGKRANPGICKRCDELRDGAKSRTYNTQKTIDAQRLAEIIAHLNSPKHIAGLCNGIGLPCTFGEW